MEEEVKQSRDETIPAMASEMSLGLSSAAASSASSDAASNAVPTLLIEQQEPGTQEKEEAAEGSSSSTVEPQQPQDAIENVGDDTNVNDNAPARVAAKGESTIQQQKTQVKNDTTTAENSAKPKTKPGPTIVSLPPKPSDVDNDDDDVASKAALALAAVAAAASANHKSPAEAAREARAVAQSFIASDDDGDAQKNKKNSSRARTVSLSAVHTNLRQGTLETGSKVLDKLSQGDNDHFLQVLLLMEHYQCVDDMTSGGITTRQESSSDDQRDIGLGHGDDDDTLKSDRRSAEACERLEAILKRVEGAYDSLVNLLPPTAAADQTETDLS